MDPVGLFPLVWDTVELSCTGFLDNRVNDVLNQFRLAAIGNFQDYITDVFILFKKNELNKTWKSVN